MDKETEKMLRFLLILVRKFNKNPMKNDCQVQDFQLPLINASNIKSLCSKLHPIADIEIITQENKAIIEDYYKCVFESSNENTEEHNFIETSTRLFPSSSNGDIFSCLEENGGLQNKLKPNFHFNFINCLVRELIDGSEQYCQYRNNNPILYFNCLQKQTTNNSVPNEFKEQSLEYAFRVPEITYQTCKSASFEKCIRKASEARIKTAQIECNIDNFYTTEDEELQKVIGNGYKCVLNKLNTKQLPLVFPALEMFYRKSIQTVVNCQRINVYADDWSFYYQFAKCIED